MGMMKNVMKRMIILLSILSMLASITGCSKSNNGTEYTIYYTNTNGNKLVEKTYNTSTKDTAVLINELIQQMNKNQKQDDYEVIKPESVIIQNVVLTDKTANIYFSTDYSSMNNATEILYRSAMVKMLTQLYDIDYVQFFVDGIALEYNDGSPMGAMSEENFINDSDTRLGSVEWKEIKLYYSNKLGDKLIEANETVACSKNVSLEKIIIEKLIKGPSSSNCYATLPSDLKLLSISVNNGVCYVNFNSVFTTEMVNVSSDIPIYSIVNSLCELDNISAVKIMVNGDTRKTFRESISLDSVFTYNEELVSLQQ
jgi:germination protein M